jgi:tRNA-Thr(GGU) m(6)t(6)A37 methyltransferase TsaA
MSTDERRDYTHAVTFPDQVTLTPVAVVRSPYTERHGTPRQPGYGQSERALATVELLDHVPVEILRDLDTFSHVWLVSWLHLNGQRKKPLVRPPIGGVKRGVFATRAPHRVNALGLTAVRLCEVRGRCLHVRGIDLLDGTPILDIKPYIPEYDAIPDASRGWLDDV